MTMRFLKSAITPVALVALLAGCQDKTPNANEATLDVSNVQGSSFDEPGALAKLTPEPLQPTAAAPPVESANASPAKPKDEPVTGATANDVPDDIALIPSMTPAAVPSATAESTPVPAPVSTEVPALAEAPTAGADGFTPVSFKLLSSFKYEEPIPVEGEKPEDVEKRRQADQIPANIKALDGTKAVVEGWMVPMEINEDGSVKSFVLVKTQPQCCFGDMQAMNEWVDVIMTSGKNAEFNVDIPVKVYGQLEVGEKTEDGFVLSVYRMKADRVEI